MQIGTGPTIVPTHRDGRLDTLLLYPDTYVGPNSAPDELTNGCWRYAGDDFLVQDSVEWRDIAPDAAFAETYQLYTVGAESPCLPKGEHRFETSVYFQSEETPVTVGLILRIDGDSPTVSVENASPSA